MVTPAGTADSRWSACRWCDRACRCWWDASPELGGGEPGVARRGVRVVHCARIVSGAGGYGRVVMGASVSSRRVIGGQRCRERCQVELRGVIGLAATRAFVILGPGCSPARRLNLHGKMSLRRRG